MAGYGVATVGRIVAGTDLGPSGIACSQPGLENLNKAETMDVVFPNVPLGSIKNHDLVVRRTSWPC